MGSVEDLSILAEGIATAILACLALVRARHGTLLALGVLWALMALLDFVLLWKPEWTTLRDAGSYILFISAMLYIWASRWIRPRPRSQRVEQ